MTALPARTRSTVETWTSRVLALCVAAIAVLFVGISVADYSSSAEILVTVVAALAAILVSIRAWTTSAPLLAFIAAETGIGIIWIGSMFIATNGPNDSIFYAAAPVSWYTMYGAILLSGLACIGTGILLDQEANVAAPVITLACLIPMGVAAHITTIVMSTIGGTTQVGDIDALIQLFSFPIANLTPTKFALPLFGAGSALVIFAFAKRPRISVAVAITIGILVGVYSDIA